MSENNGAVFAYATNRTEDLGDAPRSLHIIGRYAVSVVPEEGRPFTLLLTDDPIVADMVGHLYAEKHGMPCVLAPSMNEALTAH